MDLIQLQTFLAVADGGSFSAASTRLHSVQSNITQRIKKLEEDLGGVLFERGRAGARLTPLGERLLPQAREILSHVATVRSDLRDASGEAAPVRLGALETTAGSRLPPVLRALADRAPKAELRLVTGSSGVLSRKVWTREIDAALVVGDVDPDRFHAVPVFTETLVVVTAASGASDRVLLAFSDGCSYRAAAQTWLRQKGRTDTPVRDFGALDTILGCVGAGMGFAIAPESAVRTYNALDTLALAPLDDAMSVSTTSLIRRHDTRPTRTMRTLEAILSEQ
jgi:DNA-binding transcriptional LysR family regulator